MILLISLIFIVISGCSTSSQPPADNNNNTQVEITTGVNGAITNVKNDPNNNVVSIAVEGKQGVTDKVRYYDRASVKITGVTKVYNSDNIEISANELKQGMTVDVVFYGAVTETFPVQGNAKTIKITENK